MFFFENLLMNSFVCRILCDVIVHNLIACMQKNKKAKKEVKVMEIAIWNEVVVMIIFLEL